MNHNLEATTKHSPLPSHSVNNFDDNNYNTNDQQTSNFGQNSNFDPQNSNFDPNGNNIQQKKKKKKKKKKKNGDMGGFTSPYDPVNTNPNGNNGFGNYVNNMNMNGNMNINQNKINNNNIPINNDQLPSANNGAFTVDDLNIHLKASKGKSLTELHMTTLPGWPGAIPTVLVMMRERLKFLGGFNKTGIFSIQQINNNKNFDESYLQADNILNFLRDLPTPLLTPVKHIIYCVYILYYVVFIYNIL